MFTDQSQNHAEFIKAVLPHVYVCVFSCVWLFVTLCTVAHQAPLSMGFSKQEYWSGLPFPSPTLWEDYLIGYHLMEGYLSDLFSWTVQSLFPYWAVSGKSWEALEKPKVTAFWLWSTLQNTLCRGLITVVSCWTQNNTKANLYSLRKH